MSNQDLQCNVRDAMQVTYALACAGQVTSLLGGYWAKASLVYNRKKGIDRSVNSTHPDASRVGVSVGHRVQHTACRVDLAYGAP